MTHRLVVQMIFSCCCLIIFSGCADFPLDPQYGGPRPLPAELSGRIDYQTVTPSAVCTGLLLETPDYTVTGYEIDSRINALDYDHTIRIDWYQPKTKDRPAALMVLPILGGKNQFAKTFAACFAENGYAAFIVHRQSSYKKSKRFAEMNTVLEQIILDHRQAIDWLQTLQTIDRERIGVFGISMGGIKAALVSGLDPRIKASVIALAGGDLPGIITRSAQPGTRKRRKKFLNEHNLTPEAFHDRLKTELFWDPLRVAPYVNAENTLLFLALFDRCVPVKNGERLRHAMGDPETVYLPVGHYTAIPFVPYVKARSIRFFDRHLNRP